MCEGEYCVVCFVGYGLPIGCCLAGGAMTCYGCYRYYFLTNQRRLQEQHQQLERRQRNVVTQQPVKADTLKRKMLNKFLATMDKIHGIETTELEKCAPAEEDTSSSKTSPNDACPICFEEYDGDPTAIFMGVVKSCQHYFHFECLWEWLERNSSCPLCRTTTRLTETDILGTSFADVLNLIPDKQDNEVHCHMSREASLAQISGMVGSLSAAQISGLEASSSSTSRQSDLRASASAGQISGLVPLSSTARLSRLGASSSAAEISGHQHETATLSNDSDAHTSSGQGIVDTVSNAQVTGLQNDSTAESALTSKAHSVTTTTTIAHVSAEAQSDATLGENAAAVHWNIGNEDDERNQQPHALGNRNDDLGGEVVESKSVVSAPSKVDLKTEPQVPVIDRGYQNEAYVADL